MASKRFALIEEIPRLLALRDKLSSHKPFRNMTRFGFIIALVLRLAPTIAIGAEGPATNGPPWLRDPERVHDPSTIVTLSGVNRCLATGPGITVMRENAAGRWLREGRIFSEGKLPAWHNELVPGNRGYLWAPDIIETDGKFFIYYSVSTFGKNTSAIGLAIGNTLDPESKQWRWDDRGPVITSKPGDRFNAIDPAIFRDTNSSLWLVFGSFWDGIHLIELNPTTGLRKEHSQEPRKIAWSPQIEAPFLHRRGDYYYLFVNWGICCRGTNSTYEIRVGRSKEITGPYIDRAGVDMKDGGGTLLLGSAGRWVGPGHASIHQRDNQEWLAHHFYDRESRGQPRMRLVPLDWDAQGWPGVSGEK